MENCRYQIDPENGGTHRFEDTISMLLGHVALVNNLISQSLHDEGYGGTPNDSLIGEVNWSTGQIINLAQALLDLKRLTEEAQRKAV